MRQSHTSFPLCHHILCFIWLPYSLSLSLFFFNNKMKCHCFSGKFENGFSDMFLHFFFWKGGGTHIDDHLRPSYLNKTCASHSRRVSPGQRNIVLTSLRCRASVPGGLRGHQRRSHWRLVISGCWCL